MTRAPVRAVLPVALLALAAACGKTATNTTGASPSSQPRVQGAAGSICGSGTAAASPAPSGIAKLSGATDTLSGAGSTFVAPLMSLWTSEFSKAQGTQVAYQSIGSGAGVQQIDAQTVDFGASDAPMKDTELAAAKGGPILHIPLIFGAVVPTYHLSGARSGLKFTGDVLGKIFAGKITKWNDPALTALNPDANLPATPIAVVHRSDGSGTTSIWTDYLTKASPAWVQALGGSDKSKGKEVAWPTGIGGKGNEGVSGAVSQTDGALGYVELSYALAQNLPVGYVQNSSGKFVQPCIETVTAAAKGFSFPSDLRFSLTNSPGPDAYPITGTTWMLVYANQKDAGKAKALVNFLVWIMDDGQSMAPRLNYAPLSDELRTLAIGQIKKITLNGIPVASP
jgi:phosphate transport system substrate-binding protein